MRWGEPTRLPPLRRGRGRRRGGPPDGGAGRGVRNSRRALADIRGPVDPRRHSEHRSVVRPRPVPAVPPHLPGLRHRQVAGQPGEPRNLFAQLRPRDPRDGAAQARRPHEHVGRTARPRSGARLDGPRRELRDRRDSQPCAGRPESPRSPSAPIPFTPARWTARSGSRMPAGEIVRRPALRRPGAAAPRRCHGHARGQRRRPRDVARVAVDRRRRL